MSLTGGVLEQRPPFLHIVVSYVEGQKVKPEVSLTCGEVNCHIVGVEE